MGIRSAIDTRAQRGLETRKASDDLAVRTWRYLRVALIGLAVGLSVSVVHARLDADCWLTSISAYYYTPAQGVLVGALIAIGVSLICLRGASDGEDVLLNLAGMCAPFVALVPTPSKDEDCGKGLVATSERFLNVGNNVTALLVVAWLALAFLGFITARRWHEDGRKPDETVLVRGYWAAVALLLVANIVFLADRDLFLGTNDGIGSVLHAHNVAGFLFFALVLANVRLNAFQRYAAEHEVGLTPGRFNRYTRITLAMAAAVAVHAGLFIGNWPYAVLTLEASLIALFIVFWIAQTSERWEDGISPLPSARRTADDRA